VNLTRVVVVGTSGFPFVEFDERIVRGEDGCPSAAQRCIVYGA
jgi:hypothetical protein